MHNYAGRVRGVRRRRRVSILNCFVYSPIVHLVGRHCVELRRGGGHFAADARSTSTGPAQSGDLPIYRGLGLFRTGRSRRGHCLRAADRRPSFRSGVGNFEGQGADATVSRVPITYTHIRAAPGEDRRRTVLGKRLRQADCHVNATRALGPLARLLERDSRG
jgi:hypothetical protein